MLGVMWGDAAAPLTRNVRWRRSEVSRTRRGGYACWLPQAEAALAQTGGAEEPEGGMP